MSEIAIIDCQKRTGVPIVYLLAIYRLTTNWKSKKTCFYKNTLGESGEVWDNSSKSRE